MTGTPDLTEGAIDAAKAAYADLRQHIHGAIVAVDGAEPEEVGDAVLSSCHELGAEETVDAIQSGLISGVNRKASDFARLLPLLRQADRLHSDLDGMVLQREQRLGRTGTDQVMVMLGREFSLDMNRQRLIWRDPPHAQEPFEVTPVPNRAAPEKTRERSRAAPARRRDRDR